MKKSLHKLLALSFTIVFISTASSLYAQEPNTENLSKDELKLMKLEEKVKRYEEKVLATEDKLAYADSLIQAGFDMATEANSELKIIGQEEKMYVKNANAERKNLKKLIKKARDDEDKDKYEAELKELESNYRTETKKFEKRYSTEYKKIEKAKRNDQKGKDKLKQYKPKLKEYQQALEDAKENLENFKMENDL